MSLTLMVAYNCAGSLVVSRRTRNAGKCGNISDNRKLRGFELPLTEFDCSLALEYLPARSFEYLFEPEEGSNCNNYSNNRYREIKKLLLEGLAVIITIVSPAFYLVTNALPSIINRTRSHIEQFKKTV